jgi:cytochrome o ubiquinol oxidase subunit 1
MQSYPNSDWQPLMIVAWVGALFVLAGIICTAIQLIVSIRNRDALADVTGDPWDSRALEWSTSSPPPHYNFAHLPEVHSIDSFWEDKQASPGQHPKVNPEHIEYQDIHMPSNTAAGPLMGAFSIMLGFALVWHIWWLAGLGTAGIFISFMCRVFNDNTDHHVPAEEVRQTELRHYQQIQMQASS